MTAKTQSVLDLLRDEDLELRRLFEEVHRTGHESIQERARYGDLAKLVIRHTANREAALRELGRAIDEAGEFRRLRARLSLSGPFRRALLDRVERMSRGVQGINLNTGQNFDAPFRELTQLVGSEIESDLEEAVPALEAWLGQRHGGGELPSAGSCSQACTDPCRCACSEMV